MDGKNVEDILNELENLNPDEEDLERIRSVADEYGDKSEREILFELIELNEKMAEDMDEEKYQEIFEKLEAIRPLLNEEQSDKLDEILATLRRV